MRALLAAAVLSLSLPTRRTRYARRLNIRRIVRRAR